MCADDHKNKNICFKHSQQALKHSVKVWPNIPGEPEHKERRANTPGQGQQRVTQQGESNQCVVTKYQRLSHWPTCNFKEGLKKKNLPLVRTLVISLILISGLADKDAVTQCFPLWPCAGITWEAFQTWRDQFNKNPYAVRFL